jgi:hypothetical protein
MNPDPETAEAMHQQQGRYAAQMQTNSAHLEDDIRFEIPEWLYTEARDLYESRNGSISPEEEAIFGKLKEQYESQAKQEEPEDLNAENTLDSSKRRRVSSALAFVQPTKLSHDEQCDPANDMTGAKRKRGETSEATPKNPRLVGMSETVKQTLRRLIADAPAEKKQAAIQDSARVLHAFK